MKANLMLKCKDFVRERMETITEIISSNQHALQNETKSSAGDKHETGRAMLQLEMEKAALQLESVNQMKMTLDKINLKSVSEVGRLGSLIKTSNGYYFLSISAGQLVEENYLVMAVSLISPIGKLLLGSKAGDKISFNNGLIHIESMF